MFSLANTPARFGNFNRSADISYGSDPRQKLDVFSPVPDRGSAAIAPRPVVIFWYGGSWTAGTKVHYRFVGAALAERGFVAVLPDYRLYPQVKFPGFVQDGARAVAWVQQHAREFGGDPTRIVLMGHSAGAHEAALLALDHRYLEQAGANPRSIAGFIVLSGPYELTPNSDLLRTIFAAPYRPDDWQPVRHVDAHSPPALVIHGGADDVVISEHANRLEAALAHAGVAVEKIIYPGKGHAATIAGFSSLAPSRLPTLEKSVQFIERVTGLPTASLAPPASPPEFFSPLAAD
jgi:acetyl esterase/lipase